MRPVMRPVMRLDPGICGWTGNSTRKCVRPSSGENRGGSEPFSAIAARMVGMPVQRPAVRSSSFRNSSIRRLRYRRATILSPFSASVRIKASGPVGESPGGNELRRWSGLYAGAGPWLPQRRTTNSVLHFAFARGRIPLVRDFFL
jgi:hypothetical protein